MGLAPTRRTTAGGWQHTRAGGGSHHGSHWSAGLGGPAGAEHPCGVCHRQAFARIPRTDLCAPGDRCTDLFRAVRLPVVQAMGSRRGRRARAAVDRSLRAAAAAPHHACLLGHRVACLYRVLVLFRGPESWPKLGWPASVPHSYADIYEQLLAHVPAPRAFANVEPGSGGGVLRGTAAAGVFVARGAVPRSVATFSAAGRCGRDGRRKSAVVNRGVHHRLAAELCRYVAARPSRLVRRRHDLGDTSAYGDALPCRSGDSTGAGHLLGRLYADRGGRLDRTSTAVGAADQECSVRNHRHAGGGACGAGWQWVVRAPAAEQTHGLAGRDLVRDFLVACARDGIGAGCDVALAVVHRFVAGTVCADAADNDSAGMGAAWADRSVSSASARRAEIAAMKSAAAPTIYGSGVTSDLPWSASRSCSWRTFRRALAWPTRRKVRP